VNQEATLARQQRSCKKRRTDVASRPGVRKHLLPIPVHLLYHKTYLQVNHVAKTEAPQMEKTTFVRTPCSSISMVTSPGGEDF
jgi:hypothetical protein